MKKLIVFPLLIVLSGLLPASTAVQAQSPAAGGEQLPHRIGLIDMAQVFKKYKKFEALREDLKGDLQKSEEKFKQMAEKLRKEQTQIKQYKEGTDEFRDLEKTIVEHTAMAQSYQKSQQREFIRREAQIYKTVYLEVEDLVKKYAVAKQYTLVLRFSSEEVEGSDNPEEVMRGLNRQVVFYQPNDDITNRIVNALNTQYARASGRGDAPPARKSAARPAEDGSQQ